MSMAVADAVSCSVGARNRRMGLGAGTEYQCRDTVDI